MLSAACRTGRAPPPETRPARARARALGERARLRKACRRGERASSPRHERRRACPSAFSRTVPPPWRSTPRAEPLRRWGRALPDAARRRLHLCAFRALPGRGRGRCAPGLDLRFLRLPGGALSRAVSRPLAPPRSPSASRRSSPSAEAASRVERGFDHGVWVPLVHLFPDANVPVVQVSLPARGRPEEVVDMGRRLAPLRDEGVLILGSGNLDAQPSSRRFFRSSPRRPAGRASSTRGSPTRSSAVRWTSSQRFELAGPATASPTRVTNISPRFLPSPRPLPARPSAIRCSASNTAA